MDNKDQDKYPEEGQDQEQFLMLFIAGDSPRSLLARANLTRVLKKYGHDLSVVNVVDVLTEPYLALESNIFATPAIKPVRGHNSPLYGDLTGHEALETYLAGVLSDRGLLSDSS